MGTFGLGGLNKPADGAGGGGPGGPGVGTSEGWVELPVGTGSVTSTTAIPDGVIVRVVALNVTTAYSAGTTIKVERTGDPTVIIMDTVDNDPETVDLYSVPQITPWGAVGAGTVTVTIAGAPAVGASSVYIDYIVPADIS